LLKIQAIRGIFSSYTNFFAGESHLPSLPGLIANISPLWGAHRAPPSKTTGITMALG
jgi:hypothetical protein